MAVCRVQRRHYTGVGFWTELSLPPDAPSVASLELRVVLDGAGAKFVGLEHDSGFILFVIGGRIDTLEGYTYDEPWPDEESEYTVFAAEVSTSRPPDAGDVSSP